MATEKPIAVSTTIAARPSEVWKALTTPALVKQYFFGADVDTDWREGSPIRFHGNWQGKKFEDKGEVREVEENHRLSFSHWSPLSGQPDQPENYHVITYDLARTGDATQVVLSQQDQPGVAPIDDKTRQAFKKNWENVLAGLKKTVEHH